LKRFIATFGAILFAVAALAAGPSILRSESSTLEVSLMAIVKGIQNHNFGQAYNGLKGATERLGELFKGVKEATNPVKVVADELTRGLKAFSGTPMELEKLVDLIDNDISKLNATEVVVPSFGDPTIGVSEIALTSGNPVIRGAALDKVSSQGEALRSNFESELKKFVEGRHNTLEVLDEAKESLARGERVEKALDEISNSAAGPLLNVEGGRFAFMWLDMTTTVNPKLSDRITAAQNLVKRYDQSIAHMEEMLAKYDLYSRWVRFYRWQEWVREQSPFTADLDQAANLVAKIKDTGSKAGPAPSPQIVAIADLIRTTMRETNASLELAKQLIQQARDKDAAAAAQAEQRALIGLFAGIASLGSAVQGTSTSSPSATQFSSEPPILVPRVMRFGTPGGSIDSGQPNSMPLPVPDRP
jgi:hypothetical protein